MKLTPCEKVARILRTDKDVVKDVCSKLTNVCGHDSVCESIIKENNEEMEGVFKDLGVTFKVAHDIYLLLIAKIKRDDAKLADLIHREVGAVSEGFGNLLSFAKETSGLTGIKGKFLKLEKAKELISENPPQTILKYFGYKDAQELIEKEDILEIFAALRFMEDMDWLNTVFFKPYEKLTLDDFEEREIQAKVLSEKWAKAATAFVEKKKHNLSHLKELGLVFVIPLRIHVPGETMRSFTLALHYFHEVKFYSDLFRKYSENKNSFTRKFVSSLRGDVLDNRPSEDRMGKDWLIVQQYLAKKDPYDWRLFFPHVNPEAIHWGKAEQDVSRLSKRFGLEFEFWEGLDHVGDFFQDASGVEVLVSFNLIDTAMSLFKEKEMVKYLYHHQEAMWNKLFAGFFGEEKMEQMIIDNFDKGIISL